MFFSTFLGVIAGTFNLQRLQKFVTTLPRGLYAARNNVNEKTRHDFQFACCPSCYSVYPQDECIINLARGQQESKKCSFIKFPSHPQTRFRSPYGTVLMKTIKHLLERHFYILQNMLLRPKFIRMCETWREGASEVGTYSDVYHGQL